MTVPVPGQKTRQKTSVHDLVDYLTRMIRQADRELCEVQDRYDRLRTASKGSIVQISELSIELSRWISRRRTLIELWELTSNEVWPSRHVDSQ